MILRLASFSPKVFIVADINMPSPREGDSEMTCHWLPYNTKACKCSFSAHGISYRRSRHAGKKVTKVVDCFN